MGLALLLVAGGCVDRTPPPLWPTPPPPTLAEPIGGWSERLPPPTEGKAEETKKEIAPSESEVALGPWRPASAPR